MKFDASQFEGLELDNIGQWPAAAKLVLAIFMSIVLLVAGYMAFISDRITALDNSIKEETTLRDQFKAKYNFAANLELFKEQMIEAQALFASQLKSLPEKHETPGLLDDITFVGTTSGLNFVRLNWQAEVTKELYIELPIDIEVVGSYHDFGNFFSKVANLPRIVTLHDFDITGVANSELRLTLQAKTYRYKEAETE